MPTVIDSLVVELGLDPTKFNQQQKDALENFRRGQEEFRTGGRNIEREGRKLEDVFSSLKREVLSTAAIFLGGKGIKDFIGNMTNLDAATGRAAYTLNMSARELSIWEGAGKQAGAQAGSVTSSLKGLSSAMNTFAITGKGELLAVFNHLGLSLYDSNGRMKTAANMFLEISDAVHKLYQSDPAAAAAALSMIPGMNEDSINLMIRGRKHMEGLIDTYRKTGGATQQSVEEADKYRREMVLLDEATTNLGRSILTILLPSLISAADAFTRLFRSWNHSPDSAEGKSIIAKNRQSSRDMADPEKFMNWIGENVFPWLGMKYTDKDREQVRRMYAEDKEADKKSIADAAALKLRSPDTGGGPGRGTLAEQEAYIRKAAIKRGIDPDIAVKVWESEGKHGVGPALQSNVIRRDGTREESYGPFQLFMGKGGLGQKALSQGLDPRDPSTWNQQVDFALDEAVKNGWGPWHGWRGHPRAGLPAPGGAPGAAINANSGRQSSNQSGGQNVTIGEININTQATDADGIAREIPEAMKRVNFAANANYGLDG